MATRKKLKGLLIGIVCLAAGAIIVFSSGSSKKDAGIEKPVLPGMVKTTIVCANDATETRSFPGMAQAAYEADLAFRVGGPLTGLDVKIGQHVEEGDIIARLDSRDFKLAIAKLDAALSEARANYKAMSAGARMENIDQLEATLDASQSRLDEAESNYSRHKSLYEQKAIAKAAYDSSKSAYNTAQAQVISAKKDLEIGRKGARTEDLDAMKARIQSLEVDLQQAKNALADTILYAPAAGNIYKKYVENYEHVAPGQPIISLLNVSTVEVHTAIPQTLIAHLNERSGFTCSFDAYPGKSIRARIKEIGKKTEGPGLSYPITAVLDDLQGLEILPGMAASVNLDLDADGLGLGGFSLPVSALFADADGRSSVWKVDLLKMTVHKAKVKEGQVVGDHIKITEGLSPGDLVVTAGTRFLLEGQEVRLFDESKGTAQ